MRKNEYRVRLSLIFDLDLNFNLYSRSSNNALPNWIDQTCLPAPQKTRVCYLLTSFYNRSENLELVNKQAKNLEKFDKRKLALARGAVDSYVEV